MQAILVTNCSGTAHTVSKAAGRNYSNQYFYGSYKLRQTKFFKDVAWLNAHGVLCIFMKNANVWFAGRIQHKLCMKIQRIFSPNRQQTPLKSCKWNTGQPHHNVHYHIHSSQRVSAEKSSVVILKWQKGSESWSHILKYDRSSLGSPTSRQSEGTIGDATADDDYIQTQLLDHSCLA